MMENDRKSLLRRLTDQLYGGLKMSWLAVILFAVGAAALTAVFLVVPVFQDTSFERMGVYVEAWIFFAVIIMANCGRPLESACKTFVFFLISQPLIYLFQVPFSWQGWGLFGYYRFWFILTLLTFPAAFIGWYITQKNWLSVLIFSPVFVYLGITLCACASAAIRRFPHLLIAALFCLAQILLYVYAFFPKVPQKIVGLAIAVVTIAVLMFTARPTALSYYDSLPDEPALSASATISVEDDSIAAVSFVNPEDARIYVEAYQNGATVIVVRDGDRELNYTLEVYEDDGVRRVDITPLG